MPTRTLSLTVSILAHDPKTNRCERVIHVGRVSSPATTRAILKLVRRSMKEHKARNTF